jgi:hypothetical protein
MFFILLTLWNMKFMHMNTMYHFFTRISNGKKNCIQICNILEVSEAYKLNPKSLDDCHMLCGWYTLMLVIVKGLIFGNVRVLKNHMFLQDLELPHLLDPMHIEKNIIVSLIRTMSNAKGAKADSLALRQELEAWNMMPALHPKKTNEVDKDGKPIYHYAKPAPWIWSPTEFQTVLNIMKNARTPTNYGSSLAYKIGDKKMVGLKTHDWHNILHDLLPIAIRGTLTPGIRETVYRLSRFFKKICAKKIKIDDIASLQEEGAELACYMEMNLLPSFFDIQPHHVLHLLAELLMAGPVRPRWMYFVERYLGVLKGWVRQKARPESCIAEGYVIHEAMKFAA